MKVLWFSLSPCSSIKRKKLEHVEQGWMVSLEEEIKKNKNIQLSIAYISSVKEDAFEFDGVKYYPICFCEETSNPIIRVLNRMSSFKKGDKKILPMLLDVVHACTPELIHIHGTEERFGLIAEYVKEIPVIYSIQGLIAPYCEKYFSGFSHAEIKKYESLKTKLTFLSVDRVFKRWQYNAKREIKYLSNAKYILGRTFWDKNITYLFNPQRIYFQCEEILRIPFYENRWSDNKRTNELRLISTISPGAYKGVETLLKTAALLKKYSEIDFKWSVVGIDVHDTCYKMASKIQGIKASYCNVNLLGRKTSKELVNLLLCSDIYCHVSHIENSPNSVCEAMILGMPIVATFAGGTASLLENNVEGLLVQDGDPYVLAGSILKLNKNFEYAVSMGEKARIRALKRHDKFSIVENLIKVYEDIRNGKYE